MVLQLKEIEDKMEKTGNTILTPLVSLDTPGKATVEVIILADPVRKHLVILYITNDLYMHNML